jgi:MFS family permease
MSKTGASDEPSDGVRTARGLRDYAVVTGSYWAFTLTDGALRMLVLLYLHERGHAPMAIASMFLFYELFGVVTSLLGGWIGARFGLKSTLFSGLLLQIVACVMLAVDPARLTVVWVMVAQAFSGIAKDLTKMSSKSYIKLVVPAGDVQGLLKWVAILTGSKNTLKGVGFFLGGVLLAAVGLRGAVLGMAVGLAVALCLAVALLPKAPGKSRAKVRLKDLVSRDARINWLSAARLALFGSRDVWFVLALPIYLSVERGWSHAGVGGFLALWIVGYGLVQASAPAFVGEARAEGGARRPPGAARLLRWSLALLVPMIAIVAGLQLGAPPTPVLVAGLVVFGAIFAANSAIHSYLIVAYAARDEVALRVGFYYMANAAGRLVGTILSGVVFQLAGQGQAGLVACLGTSIALVALASAACVPLRRAEAARALAESGPGG